MPRFNSLITSLETPDEIAGGYAEQAVATLSAPLVVGPAATEPIVCDTEIDDPGANYDPVTGLYTTPAAATYRVRLACGGPPATAYAIDLTVDGLAAALSSQAVDQIDGVASKNVIDAMLVLNAGQTIGAQTTDTVGGGFTLAAARLEIDRVGD